MMSDDSENDGAFVERTHENSIYYKKYKLLLEECENIQKNNEKLVFRIEAVKRITKRRSEQVKYIKELLLTQHGEDWSEIPPQELVLDKSDLSQPLGNNATIKQEPQIDLTEPSSGKTSKRMEKSSQNKQTKKTPAKRKTPKSERDPKAPKRPSNPFFQFCQDQRQPLLEELMANLKPGQVEPNKQELTRQLALKWKTLSTQEKQIYVEMYERSKVKYAAEMSEYNMKK